MIDRSRLLFHLQICLRDLRSIPAMFYSYKINLGFSIKQRTTACASLLGVGLDRTHSRVLIYRRLSRGKERAQTHAHTHTSRGKERASGGIDHRRCGRQCREQVGREGTVRRTSSVSSDSHYTRKNGSEGRGEGDCARGKGGKG
jgi:hypothetical protein